jgi:hypothetical protein
LRYQASASYQPETIAAPLSLIETWVLPIHASFILFAIDWQALVTAIVVVIACLWIHFAFTS